MQKVDVKLGTGFWLDKIFIGISLSFEEVKVSNLIQPITHITWWAVAPSHA